MSVRVGKSRRRAFFLWSIPAVTAVGIAVAVLWALSSGHDHPAAESNAIRWLKTLISAQGLYREQDIDGDGVHRYAPTLEALRDAGGLSAEDAASEADGFERRMVVDDGAQRWWATASPERDTDLSRFFFADHSGVIRFTTGGTAGPNSPAI